MIRGAHAMFYSSDPEATRAFLRDVLALPATDIGHGWLIYQLPEAEMGVHPHDPEGEHGRPAGVHDISFYCDDLEVAVAALKAKGVEFDGEIEDHGFGLVTHFLAPGGLRMMLYQRRYETGGAGCPAD